MAFLVSILLTALLLFVPLLSQAQAAGNQEVTERLREQFIVSCLQLKKIEINHIASVSIDDIVLSARRVNLVVQSRVAVPNKNGLMAPRETAFWSPQNNTIYISAAHIEQMKTVLFRRLLTHEFFRAAGVQDENYENSMMFNSYVWMTQNLAISQMFKSGRATLALKDTLTRPAQNNVEGGTSGVGGGGDTRSMIFKEFVLSQLLARLEEQSITEGQFNKAQDTLALIKIEYSDKLATNTSIYDIATATYLINVDILVAQVPSQGFISLVISFTNALIRNDSSYACR